MKAWERPRERSLLSLYIGYKVFLGWGMKEAEMRHGGGCTALGMD